MFPSGAANWVARELRDCVARYFHPITFLVNRYRSSRRSALAQSGYRAGAANFVRGQIWRLVVMAVLLAILTSIWRWRVPFDPIELSKMIGNEPLAPIAFLAVHIAGSLFFIPRTMLAITAGIIFGMWWGIVLASLGSLAGAAAGFLTARFLCADVVERGASARLATLLARTERGGWRLVAVVRLVPIIPHSLTNYALGLTRLRFGAYVGGSLLGQLPLTIAYCDLGSTGEAILFGSISSAREVVWPGVLGIVPFLLALLIPVARRYFHRVQTTPGAARRA